MKRGFLSGAKAKKSTGGQKTDRKADSAMLETQKPPVVNQDPDKIQGLKFTYNASTGWTLKYAEHTFTHVVVPSNSPDGTTDCLIWGPEDMKLIPKYPSPIRKPPKAYEIRPSDDQKQGLVMYATGDFQPGDLILCERPFLLIPHYLDSIYITGLPTFFAPSKNPANRAVFESIFCPFFERVSKEKQSDFHNLANSHPEDGIGPFIGTYRTNSFQISLLEAGYGGNMYTALYKTSSRINHSCAGNNCQPRFDTKSFAMEIRATKDIKSGDQIYISYCDDPPGTTAERQKHLGYYAFQCTCASCTNPMSDHLYLKLLSSHEKLDESYSAWLKDLTLPDDHITKPSLLCASLIEQLGLPFKMVYYKHMEVIGKSYIALGDLENSVKHGTRLARYLVAVTGRERLLEERSDPNYYLRDASFGTRPSRGRAASGKAKVRGKRK